MENKEPRASDRERHQRQVSVERQHDFVAIEFGGPRPERLLFSQAEARRLMIEIENALNVGFGRDMDAIRRQRSR